MHIVKIAIIIILAALTVAGFFLCVAVIIGARSEHEMKSIFEREKNKTDNR